MNASPNISEKSSVSAFDAKKKMYTADKNCTLSGFLDFLSASEPAKTTDAKAEVSHAGLDIYNEIMRRMNEV